MCTLNFSNLLVMQSTQLEEVKSALHLPFARIKKYIIVLLCLHDQEVQISFCYQSYHADSFICKERTLITTRTIQERIVITCS
jgi:hypothetical protein